MNGRAADDVASAVAIVVVVQRNKITFFFFSVVCRPGRLCLLFTQALEMVQGIAVVCITPRIYASITSIIHPIFFAHSLVIFQDDFVFRVDDTLPYLLQ